MKQTIKTLAASAVLLASMAGASFADNSDIRVGFYPKIFER